MTTNEDTKWYAYTSSTQTMKAWAKQITGWEEVTPPFQTAFPEYSGPFPYTIYLPEDNTVKAHRQNKKMICLFEDQFVLLESLPTGVIAHTVALADVLYLQRGMVLLSSWLQIVTTSGSFELRFNTATDSLFKPVIEAIRQQTIRVTTHNGNFSASARPDLTQFNFLDSINYKFMNYGRASVGPNDVIVGLIYQPEQTLHMLRLFNKTFYRQYKTDHLSILTDRELIFIQEARPIRNNFDPADGGVFTYVSRRQIQSVSFVGNVMEVALSPDVRLVVDFSSTNEALPHFQNLFS